MSHGLPRKLRFAFLMQVAMASIVILAGTWAAMTVSKHQILQHAMQEEADYFYTMRDAGDPQREPPHEARLRGYTVMRLDTLPQRMARAVGLYRALGFVNIPPYWNNLLPGIEYMELTL